MARIRKGAGMSGIRPPDGAPAHAPAAPEPPPPPPDVTEAAARFDRLLAEGQGRARDEADPPGLFALHRERGDGGVSARQEAPGGVPPVATDTELPSPFALLRPPGAEAAPAAEDRPVDEAGSAEARPGEGEARGPAETPPNPYAVTPAEAPASPDTAAPARAAELAELAERLTERILIGRGGDGGAEIRMTLRGEALGRTEVTIARADGGIAIRLEPGSEAAGLLLRENGSALVERLAERLGERVTLELPPGGNQDQGRNRRSRGHDDILRYMAERR